MDNTQSNKNRGSSRSSRSMTEMSEASGKQMSETKGQDSSLTSFTEIFTKRLGPEGKKSIEEMGEKLSGYVDEAKTYIEESPKQAIAMGAAAALGVWALFFTKPGRRLCQMSGTALAPKAQEWLSSTFSSSEEKSVH